MNKGKKMDKKIKNELKRFMDGILEKTCLDSYKLVEMEGKDKDLNYLVEIELDKSMHLKFLIYCSDKKSLTIYCPIVYKMEQDDEKIMPILNVVNNVNCSIAIGKLYLGNSDKLVVTYINRVLFNDITNELTSNLLNAYITAYMYTSLEFYKQMKAEKKLNEEIIRW